MSTTPKNRFYEDDSVEDLLSSIQQMVSPADSDSDVLDLTRPLQEDSYKKEDGVRGGPKQRVSDLSPDSVHQTEKEFSSFMQAVHGVAQESEKRSPLHHKEKNTGPLHSLSLQDFLHDVIGEHVEKYLNHNDIKQMVTQVIEKKIHNFINTVIETRAEEKLTKGITAWLNTHLSSVVHDCVNMQLEKIRAQSGRGEK